MAQYKGKLYNMTEAAKELGVHRQTINYWRQKGWIKVKKDYRSFPVLTEEDIKKIKDWRNTIEEE